MRQCSLQQKTYNNRSNEKNILESSYKALVLLTGKAFACLGKNCEHIDNSWDKVCIDMESCDFMKDLVRGGTLVESFSKVKRSLDKSKVTEFEALLSCPIQKERIEVEFESLVFDKPGCIDDLAVCKSMVCGEYARKLAVPMYACAMSDCRMIFSSISEMRIHLTIDHVVAKTEHKVLINEIGKTTLREKADYKLKKAKVVIVDNNICLPYSS